MKNIRYIHKVIKTKMPLQVWKHFTNDRTNQQVQNEKISAYLRSQEKYNSIPKIIRDKKLFKFHYRKYALDNNYRPKR